MTNKAKHLAYFNFLEALEYKGCPICFLLQKKINKFIDDLMYEHVTDYHLRKKINQSLGFCNIHSWQVKNFGDGFGLSIIYEDLIKSLTNKIKKFLSLRKIETQVLFKNILKKKNKQSTCPLCLELSNSEKTCLKSFVNYFQESEFKEKYKSSFGLCLPHLFSVLKLKLDEKFIKDLLLIESEKLEQLKKELNEFQRKHDYRFSHEPLGNEKDSWIRAIEKMAGKEGIVDFVFRFDLMTQ